MKPKTIAENTILLCCVVILTACGGKATLPLEAGFGPNPQLPDAKPQAVPLVHVAPARAWPPGAKPQSAPGTQVTVFASGLDHPRWLYVLPNGDVLVAETDAPPKPDDA